MNKTRIALAAALAVTGALALPASAFAQDGNWLIRARAVLNEADKARTALATARETFKDKPDAIAALDGLAAEVGIR